MRCDAIRWEEGVSHISRYSMNAIKKFDRRMHVLYYRITYMYIIMLCPEKRVEKRARTDESSSSSCFSCENDGDNETSNR